MFLASERFFGNVTSILVISDELKKEAKASFFNTKG